MVDLSSLDEEDVSRSSRHVGLDAVDAAATRTIVVRTNGADADGKAVWSWPPDAEVK